MPSPDLNRGRGGSFFARPAARASFVAACLLLLMATVAGALRLAPMLLAGNVPIALGAVLVREVLGVALETALVVSPAVGFALAASRLVARGEARALFAIGVRPARIVATAWVVLVAVGGLAAASAYSWGTTAAAPGRLVQAMIDDARESCDAASDAVLVRAVPLAGAAWVCTPRGGRRFVAFPSEGTGSAIAAGSVAMAPDLRGVDATDVLLLVRSEASSATVRVERASLCGVPALRRPSNVGPVARAILLAATTVALAIASAVASLSLREASSALALLVGGIGPAIALLTFGSLEARPTPAVAYAVVPLVGLLAIQLARTALARA